MTPNLGISVGAARVYELIAFGVRNGLIGDWYFFGSASRGENAPSDIDLLFVHSMSPPPENVHLMLQEFLLLAPIHLVVMSKSEERELNFCDVVEAVPIRLCLASS